MILLTGATGTSARALLRRLTADGRARALPRARPAAARARARARADRARRPRRTRRRSATRCAASRRSSTWRPRSATSRGGSIEELNGVATLRLVRAAERAGVERFVFFSAIGASPALAARASSARRRSPSRRSRSPSSTTRRSRRRSSTRPTTRWITLLERLSLLPVVPVSGSGDALLPADLGRRRRRLRDGRAARNGERAAAATSSPAPRRSRYDEIVQTVAARVRPPPAAAARAAAGSCGRGLRAAEAFAGPSVFATWDEAELMELSMTTPKGTADAESLGVRPLPMRAVLGAR